MYYRVGAWLRISERSCALTYVNSPDAQRDRVTEKREGGQGRERETKGSEKNENIYIYIYQQGKVKEG